MTLLSAVIDRTLNHLYRAGYPARNRLVAAVADGTVTSWSFEFDLGGIQEGSRVSCELEDVLVWSTTPTAKTATVQRGDRGTAATAHASGKTVLVNPEWSRADVLTAINEEIAELSSPAHGLFQMKPLARTFAAGVYGYDLAADFIDLYSVHWRLTGTTKYWPELRNLRVQRDADTTDFPSGIALLLYERGENGQAFRVEYKAAFAQLGTTDETQVVETVTGLSTSGVSILPYGAAARLAAGRPIKRASTDSQGSTRRAEEVSTNDTLVSANGLLRQRQVAIDTERARLAQMYPDRLVRR